jgi:hypothetical protein
MGTWYEGLSGADLWTTGRRGWSLDIMEVRLVLVAAECRAEAMP